MAFAMALHMEIWKLSEAPKELASLYNGPGKPDWVALVPRQLDGKDLNDVILANAGTMKKILRHTASNGDIVYMAVPASANVLSHVSPQRALHGSESRA
jgi:hypothetical protein